MRGQGCVWGKRMLEPTQQKKNPPSDGESTSRYSAVKKTN